MIAQEELKTTLQRQLPELREDLRDAENSVFKIIKALKKYTINAARCQNMDQLHKSLKVAEYLYNDGSPTLRHAIACGYVSAFNSVMNGTRQYGKLKGLIPQSLYSLYIRQVQYSGI
jgi:hypothetical protein